MATDRRLHGYEYIWRSADAPANAPPSTRERAERPKQAAAWHAEAETGYGVRFRSEREQSASAEPPLSRGERVTGCTVTAAFGVIAWIAAGWALVWVARVLLGAWR